MLIKRLKQLACGLAFVLFLAPTAWSETGVADKEIVIGQSMALAGPLGDLGRDIAQGAQAYFDSVNAAGGISGRKVRLITLDDNYSPEGAARNARRFIDEERVFALFNVMGTATSEAALPILAEAQVPFFAPFTGAESVRKPGAGIVFNVRASYAEEAEKLVRHLDTVGIRRPTVVYQENSMGRDGLAGVQQAMARRNLRLNGSASIKSDASDVKNAVAAVQATSPEAIIMITAGKPTIEFIKTYKQSHRGAQIYTLSVMGTHATIKALGADGVGVVVTSVVPFPWDATIPVVKEYQAAMRKSGTSDFSFLSLEGFINAKALGEALRRTGRDLTRQKFVDTTEQMQRVNLGGFELSFGKDNHQGSRFVDLVMIGSGGKFLH